jgi:hypothetical protein
MPECEQPGGSRDVTFVDGPDEVSASCSEQQQLNVLATLLGFSAVLSLYQFIVDASSCHFQNGPPWGSL